MRPVSDQFLLQVAEISATLIGLFLVGVFFYVETGFRPLEPAARERFQAYFWAGTTIVLVLYAFALFLSLTLVVLGPVWNRVIFLLLSLLLVATNVSSFLRVRGLKQATGSAVLVVNEVVGTAAVVVLVIVPWALGGLHPTREDLTWSILLSLAVGFMSVGAVVLSVIDSGSDTPESTALP
jgi:hypothetical protein